MTAIVAALAVMCATFGALWLALAPSKADREDERIMKEIHRLDMELLRRSLERRLKERDAN